MNIIPKISIITVCYNSVDTIERTIKSVIGQTYPNIEYIVIDGGSTDGTVGVIKQYENRITKWISEPDKGIYDAMNKGIKMATGEWIHFRNSGDFFLKHDSITRFFAEEVNNDVIVIHGNCIYFDKEGWCEQTPPCLRISYKREMPVLHPATFVRASIHKAHLFDITYRSSADYDFFYKCCVRGDKMEYRPICITAFEKGGFSSNWERAFWEDSKIQGLLNTKRGKIAAYKLFVKKKIIRLLYLIWPQYFEKKIDPTGVVLKPLPFNTDF